MNLEDTSEKDWGKFLKLVEDKQLSTYEKDPFFDFFPAVIDMNKITKEDYDIIQTAIQQKKKGISFEECILSQYDANPNWEEHYNNENISLIRFHNGLS